MYILVHPESKGVYAVKDDDTLDRVVQIFEEKDDAERYCNLLQASDMFDDELELHEVEKDIIVDNCNAYGYNYAIITQNDIVFPIMIIFETIRWKNFLSTGNHFTEVKLNESPSTLIVGANGAGKSTILDALCFCLFNKPFRKINKPQLVNSINEKDCLVEVNFSIGSTSWKVCRGIKPAVFEIYRDGNLLDQAAATTDQQKWLEQTVLKLNYKSFTQVVILGSSTFVPFMQLPAAHRREVIEDLLDIQIFTHMNVILKDRIKITKEDLKDCEYQLSLAEQKFTMQKIILIILSK